MAKIFSGANKADGTELQQLRQPDALLRQLYHDEINPRFRVPDMPGLRLMIVTSILSLILFAVLVTYKFNNFVMLSEDMLAAKGNLEAAIQRRANLFDNVIKLTLNHAELEHAVFSHTSDMRSEIIKQSKLGEKLPDDIKQALAQGGASPEEFARQLKSAMSSGTMEGSLGRLMAIVEQYPNIKSSETYKQAMTSIVEMEDRIAQRRLEFHETMRVYNSSVQNFPWSYLAQMTGFLRYQYYEAETAERGSLRLDPQVYEQLMPLGVKKGGDQ